MDLATYAVEAEVEATHWWFVGRRRLFSRLVTQLDLEPGSHILDIGTSTGTNLRMLRDLGFQNVSGLDFSDEAIRWCASKGLPKVHKGDACALPFPDASVDLVLATDIIEHVDDDARAVAEIKRVLKPGGHVLITVPSFMSLWGLQDRVAAHKRRYRMEPLIALVRDNGLSPLTSFYFNFLLFVPIWCARRIIDLMHIEVNSENEINSPLMNKILACIFNLDIRLAPRLSPPFGVSALVLARRP